MAAPLKHILQQVPVISALGRTAAIALAQQLRPASANAVAVDPAAIAPGPLLSATVSPRPRDLVRDYVRAVGGQPSAYRSTVPAHFFPQWGFPLFSKTLEGIPYPIARVLNGGCNITINAPLPADTPLSLTAQLVNIDDNGSRAVLEQRLVTGTQDHPEALVATMFAIVPLKRSGKKARKAKPTVPLNAHQIDRWKIPQSAGRDFAMLTGDFNPIHWVTPYAKASGFKSTILHGFATMARAIESLNRVHFSGDVTRLATFDCKFVKPLVLPARVGLFMDRDAQQVFVGDAPGGPAYLVAGFTTGETR